MIFDFGLNPKKCTLICLDILDAAKVATAHSALKGGVRNFFHDRVEQALISHLYGSCDLRSTLCRSNLSILGPPEPKNCPKWPKSLQNDAKSGFDSSGGPKRLDRLGSWLDLFMGRPTQPIGSNFGIRGVPNFGPGRLKMAQIAPK